MLVLCSKAKHKHTSKASSCQTDSPWKQHQIAAPMFFSLFFFLILSKSKSILVAVQLHPSTHSCPPDRLSWVWGSVLIYLQTVLRWDRSSIINVGGETLACVFIGPGPLDARHSICPAALHTQQLSGPAERGALASCFVEAPLHHCPQSPKLT